jgi:hypothetical protein
LNGSTVGLITNWVVSSIRSEGKRRWGSDATWHAAYGWKWPSVTSGRINWEKYAASFPKKQRPILQLRRGNNLRGGSLHFFNEKPITGKQIRINTQSLFLMSVTSLFLTIDVSNSYIEKSSKKTCLDNGLHIWPSLFLFSLI